MKAATKPTTYDWKAYGQKRAQVTVRMDRQDKQQLDTALQNRGETVSELLMAYLKPIITEGTPEGQRAHELISAAVQESIAWNRTHDQGGYGTTQPACDATGQPIPFEDWRSPTIVVRPRITKGGDRVLYHVVKQSQGMARQDAIRRYVANLMDVWSDAPEQQRESILAELADPDQHRFIMGYVNAKDWTRFDAAHEMQLHFSKYVEPNIAEPQNDDELCFTEWATLQLTAAWAKQRRIKSDIITLIDGVPDDAGVLWSQSFRHYQIRSDAENIAAWAGAWLNEYRQMRRSISHELAIGELMNQQIRITMMRFTEG